MERTAPTPKAGESLDVVARTYHTENGNVHEEGETYAVTDPVLAETLYAIGFVTIDGWTPPPPEGGGSPPTRSIRSGYLGQTPGRPPARSEILDDRRDR